MQQVQTHPGPHELPRSRCSFAREFAAFFSLVLIASTLAAAGPGAVSDNGRLPRTIVPTNQSLHLILDPSRDHFHGSTEIELVAHSRVDQFRLHFLGESVSALELRGEKSSLATEHLLEKGTLRVEPEEPLAPGRYRLKIGFTASFGGPLEGIYRVERDQATYIFSVFQPIDARRAFPCWDEPGFKIPFHLTLTVPESHLPISNTLEELVRVEDGWKTVVFRPTRPVPSYGMAVASGPFETTPIEGLGVPARIVTTPGQGEMTTLAAEATRRLLPALESYLGQPYPYGKLDLLAVPGFPSGGLENPAAPIFSEGRLLLDPDSAQSTSRLSQAIILAHELSHMWFGNQVTVAWWDDIWLNESFATWISYKMVGEVFPELGAEALRIKSLQRAFELDSLPGAPAIRGELSSPGEAFSVNAALVYEKGSQVLTMFERFVGEDRFRESLREHLTTHAWRNATSGDFWGAIDRGAGRNVSAALQTFLEQPGVPVLVFEELGGGKIRIHQRQLADSEGAGIQKRWKIPILLRFPSDVATGTKAFLLEEESQIVHLPSAGAEEPKWFFPNAEASGYFRWSLPAGAMRRLAEEASKDLAPVERLDFLSNLSTLFAVGEISSEVYLETAGRFRDDPDPAVSRALVDLLGDFRSRLVTPELEPAYARYVREILTPIHQRIGLERQPGEAEGFEALRADLYFLLGGDGEQTSLRHDARERVEDYLRLPEPGSEPALPPLIEPALRLAALKGDSALFTRYWQRFLSTTNPRERRMLLIGLGSFSAPELHQTVLTAYLEGSLGPGDLALLAGILIDGTRGSETLYQWMKESYAPLKAQLPPIFRSFLPRFAGGCSAERLADARVFFDHPEHRVPGSDTQLEQVAAEVEDCLRLRERERQGLERFLAAYR